jgi:hypothetical protein
VVDVYPEQRHRTAGFAPLPMPGRLVSLSGQRIPSAVAAPHAGMRTATDVESGITGFVDGTVVGTGDRRPTP